VDDVLAHASHSEGLDCAAEVDDDFEIIVFGVFCSDVSYFFLVERATVVMIIFGDHLLLFL
jgi:hypothetical protein